MPIRSPTDHVTRLSRRSVIASEAEPSPHCSACGCSYPAHNGYSARTCSKECFEGMGRAAQAHTTSPSAEEIRQVFGEDYDWNLDAIPQDISAEIHQDPSHHKNDIELHGEDPEGIPENKPDAPWALAHMLKNCPRDPTSVEHVMGIVNGIMRGYGVEPLTDEHSYVSHYWQRTMALYVNTGDAYADTILYDCEGRNFLLGSWGSFYEDWQSTHEYRDPQEAED